MQNFYEHFRRQRFHITKNIYQPTFQAVRDIIKTGSHENYEAVSINEIKIPTRGRKNFHLKKKFGRKCFCRAVRIPFYMSRRTTGERLGKENMISSEFEQKYYGMVVKTAFYFSKRTFCGKILWKRS